jgi:hypothetical protein
MSRSCLKATRYGFADIFESFGFRASLRNAAGNRRAFGYRHSALVGLQCDKELHICIVPQLAPNGPARDSV